MENLPLPEINSTIYTNKYCKAGSCLVQGSAACMNITATSMVMISGIVAILVAKPVKRNTEQITSVKTVRPKESSALMPNTGGNCTGASENSIINLGIPCVNINTAIP